VDLDHGELPDGVPPPSVLIASSPGRLQAYWRLREPVPPPVGERCNRLLGLALGADPSGWDLTQLLRIPGTRNYKYPDAPMVTVLSLTAQTYDVADLLATLPTPPSGPTPRVSSLPRQVVERAPGA